MKKAFLILLGLGGICMSIMGQYLLPLPQSLIQGKGSFRTDIPFVVTSSQNQYPVDTHLLNTWKGLRKTNQQGSITRKIIFKEGKDLSSDEAYQLHISKDSIEIFSKSPAGRYYAQATLQQLHHKEKIPCATINDAPAFTWRGAMIDVSRHFYPITFLKKQIDILSSFKINRLHLHLTDAAGWRMEIKRYPRLTSLAAWRTDSLWKTWWNGGRKYVDEGTEGAYGGYYTQDELRDLVKYAQQRNITIIPEIEMPAHSEEVLTAYPELSCTHEPYRQADFCPGNIATYDFLENVLKEVMDVFPSPYIHVGGDEAGKASWGNCPLCQKKMKEEKIKEVKGLQTYLIRRIGEFLHLHRRQLVGWDEIIDGNLAPGTHVMVWRGMDNAAKAIQHGYDVILTPGSHCYLDAYQDAPDTQPEAIGGFLSLEKAYSFDPFSIIPADQKSHVKGIQGNLWTEYVPSESHAEYMLYPRILALAELGWKGTEKKNYAHFRERALTAVDRLHQQQVNAFNLRNEIGDRPAARQTLNHKAIGATITYNHPVSPYYKGNSEQTLIDGVMGGWNFGDGRWQGFIGRNCVDVTIDLGKQQKIKQVGTDFLQYSSPEIFYPGSYKVSISNDGSHFTEIFQKSHTVDKLPLVATDFWTWHGKKQARYIRIEAQSGQLGGWIFIDEIKVL